MTRSLKEVLATESLEDAEREDVLTMTPRTSSSPR
jgi:hypothetical protein